MKLITIAFLLLIIILLGCNQNFVKSYYPIPSKMLFKKNIFYKKAFGKIFTLVDTIIIEKNLSRNYKDGLLTKIGNVYNQKPIGYWFLYDKKGDLEYILKYGSLKTDSFFHPFSIINQRW